MYLVEVGYVTTPVMERSLKRLYTEQTAQTDGTTDEHTTHLRAGLLAPQQSAVAIHNLVHVRVEFSSRCLYSGAPVLLVHDCGRAALPIRHVWKISEMVISSTGRQIVQQALCTTSRAF